MLKVRHSELFRPQGGRDAGLLDGRGQPRGQRAAAGDAAQLFAALLGRKKLSAEQIEKLKQIVGELE